MTEKELKLKIFGSENYIITKGTWSDKIFDCCLVLNNANSLTDEMIEETKQAVLKMREASVTHILSENYLK